MQHRKVASKYFTRKFQTQFININKDEEKTNVNKSENL